MDFLFFFFFFFSLLAPSGVSAATSDIVVVGRLYQNSLLPDSRLTKDVDIRKKQLLSVFSKVGSSAKLLINNLCAECQAIHEISKENKRMETGYSKIAHLQNPH